MIRMLSLGDSYTIGEGVPQTERWPAQLAEQLRGRGWQVAEPVLIARTGWRADELLAALDQAAPTGPFDLVTLLVGVNDQYQGRSVEAARPAVRSLLASAVALAACGAPGVLVLSIPDWGVTPFAAGRSRARIATEIDAFNEMLRVEAQRAGTWFLEITALTRQAGQQENGLAADGLHPSGSQYAGWVNAALPTVLRILSRSCV